MNLNLIGITIAVIGLFVFVGFSRDYQSSMALVGLGMVALGSILTTFA